jgi:hypothetical protein
MECVEVGVNVVTVSDMVEDACEAELSHVSLIQPIENVDTDTSGWSNGDNMVNSGLNSFTILDGKGMITAYSNWNNQTLGQITHRGTRGIGINGGVSDEINGNQRMVVEFIEPVYLVSFEVRSLFIEGNPPAAEQGTVLLFNDAAEVADIQLIAVQSTGGVGQLITVLEEPMMVDRIEFFVPQGQGFSSFSEFALAKITIAEVTELVNIHIMADHANAVSFDYMWNTGDATSSLMGVEPGTYSVVVSALDEFGVPFCSAEQTIVATANCDEVTFPIVPDNTDFTDTRKDNNNILSDDDMINASETLLSAYPNPFTTETTIEFRLVESAEVTLEVFNLVGERVAVIYQGHVAAFDNQKFSFRAESLPNGIYIYRLTAGENVYHDRIILAK